MNARRKIFGVTPQSARGGYDGAINSFANHGSSHHHMPRHTSWPHKYCAINDAPEGWRRRLEPESNTLAGSYRTRERAQLNVERRQA